MSSNLQKSAGVLPDSGDVPRMAPFQFVRPLVLSEETKRDLQLQEPLRAIGVKVQSVVHRYDGLRRMA